MIELLFCIILSIAIGYCFGSILPETAKGLYEDFKECYHND